MKIVKQIQDTAAKIFEATLDSFLSLINGQLSAFNKKNGNEYKDGHAENQKLPKYIKLLLKLKKAMMRMKALMKLKQKPMNALQKARVKREEQEIEDEIARLLHELEDLIISGNGNSAMADALRSRIPPHLLSRRHERSAA